MKNLINKFLALNGVQFISINNYLAKTSNELANHTINVNFDVMNAKKKDFAKLQKCSKETLNKISIKTGISLDICKIALNELIVSAQKNLSNDINDRTNQSKGQTDAYINITKAIRLHKETLELFVFGQPISKKIINEGVYKKVNSSPKTLAKRAIEKELKFTKFRSFSLGNAEYLKVSKDTLIIPTI